MSSIKEMAELFFDACETGKGWEGCQQYCLEGASFSAQAGALKGIDTLQAYTEWWKGMLTLLPDGRYEVRSTRIATTWPRTAWSVAPTLGKAVPCLRPGIKSRRTTCMRCSSTVTRSVI